MNNAAMAIRFPTLNEALKGLGLPHRQRGELLQAACADEDQRRAAEAEADADDNQGTAPPDPEGA